MKTAYTIEQEVKIAYADCWMDWDKSKNIRNLDFMASDYLTKDDAKHILSKYITGYNNFTPDLLDLLPDDSMVKIAREGSVCLYVVSEELKTSPKLQQLTQKALGADEFDYVNDEFRIWWD